MAATPYTTSAFLKSLFYKYGVHNKTAQFQLTYLYGDLIDYILQNASDAQRIYIFRSFFKVFEVTIEILRKDNFEFSASSEKLVQSLVGFCKQLLVDTVFKLQPDSEIFRHILGQVNLDNLVCDIGDLVGQYRDDPVFRKKIEIVCKLRVLLADYNFIADKSLTVRDVISRNNGVQGAIL